nr:hypothetical protein GCM10020093_026820 [Planobispora longispora]
MQMVFQDPLASLDPRQSVESVLSEPLRAHGFAGDRSRRVRELLDLVGLPAGRPPATRTSSPAVSASASASPGRSPSTPS